MPAGILPNTFVLLLAAFEPCFSAPTYRTFGLLVAGWIHCLGRRTVTAVALASGAIGRRHISVFHRFFGRATWSLDAVGRVVFHLAPAWIPADQPLVVLVDDTLARKSGKGISLATMHHDPLLSTARKPFCTFGHVWVMLALWAPLRWAGRAASPCRSCSGCTSARSAGARLTRPPDHAAAPGSGRRRPPTPRTRGRPSWSWPAS